MGARTNPDASRKHDGISLFLIPMDHPGLEIRATWTIGDERTNEVFFDDVFVPKDQVVGELHKGWTVAKALLGHERFMHPVSDPYRIAQALDNLKHAARETPAGNGVTWDDPRLRQKVVSLEMDIDCMRYTRLRAMTRVQKGEAPGPETQIFKMFGAELMQKIVELHQEVVGPLGVIWEESPFAEETGETAKHSANIRAATLRGGTSEVQRNVIAKRVLELPE